MIRRTAFAASLLGLVAFGSFASLHALPPAESSSAVEENADPYAGTVTARLLADVEAAAPGEPFTLGIEITMAPGWHTYWENGGDAGLPTSVEWTLPEGFEAGPLIFPVPHRYTEEGDLVTFGYADKVVLLTEITPAASVAPGGRAEIQGEVAWLQCKDLCIPGGDTLAVRLPVEAAARPAPAPVLETFGRARAQLPQPVSSLSEVGLHTFQSHDAIPVGAAGEVAVVFEGLSYFTCHR